MLVILTLKVQVFKTCAFSILVIYAKQETNTSHITSKPKLLVNIFIA
jgi:hypothetical protein